MANKRCCSSFIEKGGGCPVHSKIKMVFMFKPEFLNKEYHKSGPVFWNRVYTNNQPDERVVKGMLDRMKGFFPNKFNSINFYKEGIEQPIHVHKP